MTDQELFEYENYLADQEREELQRYEEATAAYEQFTYDLENQYGKY